MKFKTRLRRIGNSRGVIIPLDVITGYRLGDEIELEVITGSQKLPLKEKEVITTDISPVITKDTKPNWEFCKKHKGFKSSCGCK